MGEIVSISEMLKLQMASSSGALAREEQERFLLSLLSLGLERVAAEPERLVQECKKVKQDTESHAVDNYSAFLQSAVCVRKVREELEFSGRLLHELAAEVPSLHTASSHVEQHARDVESLRKDTHTTAKMHNQVLELLEVPQLMDTAVRNEYYEEALELGAFARKMHSRFAHIPLMRSLLQSVERSEDQMLQLLLQKLQSSIQLPVCLHVIGILRRMGRQPDQHLRCLFLQCRDHWLQTAIDDALRQGSVYNHICKVTDVVRMYMFEIMTQYRAIFLDYGSGSEGGSGGEASSGGADGGLLYAWANRRVLNFISFVDVNLGKIKEGSQVASILEKVMYCGAYLGREGLDFRGAIQEPFCERIAALLRSALNDSRQSFHQALASHRFSTMPDAIRKRYQETVESGAGDLVCPPAALLMFVPLAVLCNKVMECLNDMRECAILSSFAAAEAAVSELLLICCEDMALAFADAEEEGILTGEKRPHFLLMIKTMEEVLVPWVSKALETLFARASTRMDMEAIVRPIHELLILEEECEREAAKALAARQAQEEEARRQAEAAAAAALKTAQQKERVAAEKSAKQEHSEAVVEAADVRVHVASYLATDDTAIVGARSSSEQAPVEDVAAGGSGKGQGGKGATVGGEQDLEG